MSQEQDTTTIPLTSTSDDQIDPEIEHDQDIDESGLIQSSPTLHPNLSSPRSKTWKMQNPTFSRFWRLLPLSWSIERNPDVALPHVLTLLGFLSLCIFIFSVPTLLQIVAKEAPTPPGTNPDIDEAASIIKGNNGAVAADNQICSELGVKIMQDLHGNAIDSMVSTVLCQGILSPFASGIGGGAFILIHDEQQELSTFYDARETAPSAAKMSMYNSNSTTSRFGGLAVAVPGELKGLHMAHKEYGILSWEQVVTPVIEIAENAKVSQFLAIVLKQMKDTIFSSPSLSKIFTKTISQRKEVSTDAAAAAEIPGVRRNDDMLTSRGVVESLKDPSVITDANNKDKHGVNTSISASNEKNETHKQILLEEGDKLVNPQLIKLLKRISIKGPNAFYIDSSNMIAKEIEEAGGVMTSEDIKQYKVKIRNVVTSTYHGFQIIGAPVPSTGGASIGMLLNMIKELRFRRIGRNQLSYHLLIECFKFVFAEAMNLGDPEYVKYGLWKMGQMLSRRLAIKRVYRIDREHTYEPRHYSRKISLSKLQSGTSHVSIIDKNGTGVSITSSINLPFGAGIVSKSTGVILNDQMDAFTTSKTRSNAFGLYPTSENDIQGGKRPLSSMCPTIILHDGRIYIIVGGSGGPKAITGVAETILNLIDFGDSLSDAISAPRIHHQLVPNLVSMEGMNSSSCEESHSLRKPSQASETKPGESSWPYLESVCKSLKKVGHKIEGPAVHGAVQAIMIPNALQADVKKLKLEAREVFAASDPRKIGRAAAY